MPLGICLLFVHVGQFCSPPPGWTTLWLEVCSLIEVTCDASFVTDWIAAAPQARYSEGICSRVSQCRMYAFSMFAFALFISGEVCAESDLHFPFPMLLCKKTASHSVANAGRVRPFHFCIFPSSTLSVRSFSVNSAVSCV